MKQIWYHQNCNDGTTAAAIALKALTTKTEIPVCIPVSYGQLPPEIKDDDRVWIVDFSYPRVVMEPLAATGRVMVLDHHKTAEAELAGLPNCFFDMKRCGAVMVCDFFSLSSVRPHGLELIQDRDLWTKLWPEETDAFTAGLGLYDQVPGPEWLELVCTDRYLDVVVEGRIVLKANQKLRQRLMKNAWLDTWDDGLPAVMMNTNVFQSDLGHDLLEKNPHVKLAVMWHEENTFTKYSLRSRSASECDVSALAKRRGGGGHPCAAGFEIKKGVKP